MGTKEKLLSLLETRKGEYLSGEEIAQQLEVSRTAVWKAVKTLQSAGYEIVAVQNKGYCLSATSDILSEQGIRKFLDPQWSIIPEVLPTATSTNALLREKANGGAPEGYAVLANAQTNGRGRLGRQFYSPADTGIYLSLLLRPVGYSPDQAIKVTTMAAVAASKAIEEISGKKAKIKWVNDIYMDGRKVCGILTEGAFGLEIGSLEYIVLGVGINAYEPQNGFPEDIVGIAGAVFEKAIDDGKNRLAAAFLNHFMECYQEENHSCYAQEYRNRSLVIGREVTVISGGMQRGATALDVDGDCRLIVRYKDGSIQALSSAEVSIRPVQGGKLYE